MNWVIRIVAVSIAVLGLSFTAMTSVSAQDAVLGPEGRAYSVETRSTRFVVRFTRDGRYEDSRGLEGFWSFDGRTLCVLVREPGPNGREVELCRPWRDMRVGVSEISSEWTLNGERARVSRIE
ncbi:MAG: hypothetical protein AAFX09_10675 [Pseudomonadota bacterium]